MFAGSLFMHLIDHYRNPHFDYLGVILDKLIGTFGLQAFSNRIPTVAL